MTEQSAVPSQLAPWAMAGFFAGLLVMEVVGAPAAQLPATSMGLPSTPAPAGRVFSADAGVILKFVRPDRSAEFESTLGRLHDALQRSANPVRREQAAGWRVYRALQTATNGDLVYVVEIDPAVKGADYAVATILGEAFPGEAESVYRRYADAHSGTQQIADLILITAFGSP